MAVHKQDLVRDAENAVADQCAKVEKLIDARLREEYVVGYDSRVCVASDLLKHPAVRSWIETRYTKAGWCVWMDGPDDKETVDLSWTVVLS